MAAGRTGLETIPSSGEVQSAIDRLSQILGFIFSWIILLSIGVIVSGKFLAHVFPMRGMGNNYFRIPLFIFRLEAQNDEVVLGLSGFIITLLVVAPLGGANLYHFVVASLGIDPGQFNTLCFSSAVITVAWSISLWVFTTQLPTLGKRSETEKTGDLINKIERRIKHDQTVRELGHYDV
jgi:hypothetical protein